MSVFCQSTTQKISRDVAIIFHAHLLSPFKFLSDIRGWPSLASKYGRLSQYADLFQLTCLSERAGVKNWSCRQSEKIWSEAYSTQPYQLWTANPRFGGQLIGLPPIDSFPCPKSGCGYCPSRTLEEWMSERNKGHMRCICSSSTFHIQRELLARDIATFLAAEDDESAAKYLKGTCINSKSGRNQTFMATRLLRTLDLQSVIRQGNENLGSVYFPQEMQQGLDWSNQNDETQDILRNMKVAYTASPWRQFSLCLVSAVQRQRSFLDKVTDRPSLRSQVGLDSASKNYYKFMMLVKAKRDRGLSDGSYLVPTIEIDLFWHTHQLMPWFYHAWCKENIGFRVNHDDTLAESVLSENRDQTAQLWKAEYQDSYDVSILPKKRFSLFASRSATKTELVATAALTSYAVLMPLEQSTPSPPSSPEPEHPSKYTGMANVAGRQGANCGGCGGCGGG